MGEMGETVKKVLKVVALTTAVTAGVLKVADNRAQEQDETQQRSSYTQEQINELGLVVNLPDLTEKNIDFQNSIFAEELKLGNKIYVSEWNIDVPNEQQLRVRNYPDLNPVSQTNFLGIIPEEFRGKVYTFTIEGEKDPRDGSANANDWIVIFLPPKTEGEKPYLGVISTGMLTDQSLESDHHPVEVTIGNLDKDGFPTATRPDGSTITIGQILPIPQAGTT